MKNEKSKKRTPTKAEKERRRGDKAFRALGENHSIRICRTSEQIMGDPRKACAGEGPARSGLNLVRWEEKNNKMGKIRCQEGKGGWP